MKMMQQRWMMGAAISVVAAMSLMGCASGGSSTDSARSSASAAEETLTIFAAASLSKPFAPLIKTFESTHPGVTIKTSFAGSSTLVQQIQHGAPADLMASADSANMDKLAKAQLLEGEPTYFARNKLAIVTPPANPGKIKSLNDLTKSGVDVVTCATPVPCGSATQTLQQQAKLKLHPVSEENAVTDVLAKVRSGNADAGIVYVSDAKGAGSSVNTIAIPDSVNVINDYPAAVVKGSKHAKIARAFIAFLTSTSTQQALRDDGFLAPKP